MPPMQDNYACLPETETETDTHVFDTAIKEWEKCPPNTQCGKRIETEMHVYDTDIGEWGKREDGSWYRCEYIRLSRQSILPATHILKNIHTGQFRVASNNSWMRERKITRVLVLGEAPYVIVAVPSGVTVKMLPVSEETLGSTFESSVSFISSVVAEGVDLLIVDADNCTHVAPTLVAYLVSDGWPLERATSRICEVYGGTFTEHTQACLLRWNELIQSGSRVVAPVATANDTGSPTIPTPSRLRVEPTPHSCEQSGSRRHSGSAGCSQQSGMRAPTTTIVPRSSPSKAAKNERSPSAPARQRSRSMSNTCSPTSAQRATSLQKPVQAVAHPIADWRALPLSSMVHVDADDTQSGSVIRPIRRLYSSIFDETKSVIASPRPKPNYAASIRAICNQYCAADVDDEFPFTGFVNVGG